VTSLPAGGPGAGARLPALALGAAGTLALLQGVWLLADPTLPWVLGMGLVLGAAFVLLDFGFTAGFRSVWQDHDGRDLAASFVVPAVAALVIVPVGTHGAAYGRLVAPIGLPLLLGAALFGVGMQLCNGCGSGTLVAVGQGSRRMWVTLPFFCVGGVLGGLVFPALARVPGLGVIDLPGLLGPWGGLAATEALLGLLAVLLLQGRRPRSGRLAKGAVIGALAALYFLVSGEPWGITMAMTVWAAKAMQVLGINLAATEFWSSGWTAELLAAPLLSMHATVSNLSIVLGALLASAAQGRLRHQVALGAAGALGAALGGLCMGVGARLSFGCNVGAFLGGAASGSVHGVVWLLAALPGSWLGIRVRPWFGLPR
jgi:uncharacterized protein